MSDGNNTTKGLLPASQAWKWYGTFNTKGAPSRRGTSVDTPLGSVDVSKLPPDFFTQGAGTPTPVDAQPTVSIGIARFADNPSDARRTPDRGALEMLLMGADILPPTPPSLTEPVNDYTPANRIAVQRASRTNIPERSVEAWKLLESVRAWRPPAPIRAGRVSRQLARLKTLVGSLEGWIEEGSSLAPQGMYGRYPELEEQRLNNAIFLLNNLQMELDGARLQQKDLPNYLDEVIGRARATYNNVVLAHDADVFENRLVRFREELGDIFKILEQSARLLDYIVLHEGERAPSDAELDDMTTDELEAIPRRGGYRAAGIWQGRGKERGPISSMLAEVVDIESRMINVMDAIRELIPLSPAEAFSTSQKLYEALFPIASGLRIDCPEEVAMQPPGILNMSLTLTKTKLGFAMRGGRSKIKAKVSPSRLVKPGKKAPPEAHIEYYLSQIANHAHDEHKSEKSGKLVPIIGDEDQQALDRAASTVHETMGLLDQMEYAGFDARANHLRNMLMKRVERAWNYVLYRIPIYAINDQRLFGMVMERGHRKVNVGQLSPQQFADTTTRMKNMFTREGEKMGVITPKPAEGMEDWTTFGTGTDGSFAPDAGRAPTLESFATAAVTTERLTPPDVDIDYDLYHDDTEMTVMGMRMSSHNSALFSAMEMLAVAPFTPVGLQPIGVL